MELNKKDNESKFDFHKRLIYGKLIDKTLLDEDYTELSKLVYDKEYSSDVARRMMYGSRYTLELFENEQVENTILNTNDIEKELAKNYKNVVELNKDGSQTSDKLLQMSEEQCKDVIYLLKSHGYDIKSWELVSARNNIWNSYSKTDGILTLYSSKITVKPRTEYLWNEEDVQKIFNNLHTDYKNKINIFPTQYEKNGNLLIVPIADLHYGLLSDKFSTGNDYNLDIAEQVYYYAINDVLNRYSNRNFEKVLFIIGNDFINADNLSGTTQKGTPQDNSSLWFNTVDKATQLVVNGIDMLTQIAPVDVVYVPSNHDLHTMFGIMQTIKAWYRNDDNVIVDDSPLPRKYYKFGKTLLPLSHDIKIKEALKIITSEGKDNWSNSEHIICLIAHLHQAMVYEKQGYLEIWRLPCISGWSRWSNNQGYIQAEKKNQCFVVNGDLGITDILNTVIK